MLKFFISLCASMAIVVVGASSALAVTEKIITLTTNDIAYDPATGLIYAAMPSTAANDPNSLLPMNPTTGTLGTAIAVGQNPTHVVSSGDGTYLYVVANNSETVQRYDPASNAFATPLSILNGLNVSQIVAVPGYSDVVAISQNNPGFSPPAFQTAIYENGSALPNHVGNGIGVGGPDIIAVDNTGTEFYGYQNTVTEVHELAGNDQHRRERRDHAGKRSAQRRRHWRLRLNSNCRQPIVRQRHDLRYHYRSSCFDIPYRGQIPIGSRQ